MSILLSVSLAADLDVHPLQDDQSHSQMPLMIMQVYCPVLVGRGGLEPPTSRLSGVRSNHLSYRPNFFACFGLCPQHAGGAFRFASANRQSQNAMGCAKARRDLVEPIGIEPMTS